MFKRKQWPSTILVLCFVLVMQLVRSQSKPDFYGLVKLYQYDASLAMDLRDSLIEQSGSVTVSQISFASPVRGRVSAFLVKPSKNGKYPALIFGHWGPGNKTEFLPEAKLYAEAGVVSLLVDYPWVRPAPWRVRRGNGFDEPEVDRDASIQAVVDIRRGLDYLSSLREVDLEHIAYVGHSYGAQWGAILASIEKRIKAFVLVGGVPDAAAIFLEDDDPSLVEIRQTMLEKIKKHLEIYSVTDAINYIGHAAPHPMFFQFARYEQWFGEAAMKRYYEAASEPKTVQWYSTGHDLNDIQVLIDRTVWLSKNGGIPSILPVLKHKIGGK